MGGQMKSRAEASMRRIVDRVTKEAKARMERKPSGEKKGMSKGGREDLLHPYTAKKSSGGMSDLEKVVVALLALGLLGIGGLVFKGSRASNVGPGEGGCGAASSWTSWNRGGWSSRRAVPLSRMFEIPELVYYNVLSCDE